MGGQDGWSERRTVSAVLGAVADSLDGMVDDCVVVLAAAVIDAFLIRAPGSVDRDGDWALRGDALSSDGASQRVNGHVLCESASALTMVPTAFISEA